jgi:hypothetical protein
MSDSEYIAYGRNEDADDNPLLAYWIASWDDDGPTGEETYADCRATAQIVAEQMSRERGLEAVEVDEFGAVIA